MHMKFWNAGRGEGLSDRRSLAVALIALSGLSAGAMGQAKANAAGADPSKAGTGTVETAERMSIPIGIGSGTSLKVRRPDAFQSEAIELGSLPESMASLAPVHTVYGRAVIVAESRDAAVDALGAIRAEFPWINPAMLTESVSLPGVFSIEVRSIRNAARVVELLRGRPGVTDAMVDIERQKAPRSAPKAAGRVGLSAARGGGGDPALTAQWHIDNIANVGFDHKIAAVNDSGITGTGVVVGVLEANRGNFNSPYDQDDPDFASVVHPDLFPNYRNDLSQVTDPFQIDVTHETSVAGLIGAVGDNGAFGRGVAFNAGLAALRNGSSLEVSDAFAHELQEIDIVNNSWGPSNITFPPFGVPGITPISEDDFEVTPVQVRAVHPAGIESLAIARGLDLGRDKKSRVYVFAAGNGNHFQGFNRFRIGNAISLPQFGYLDIVDDAVDGPLADFDFSGADAFGWRYSGMIGDRTEYWPLASDGYTFAIGAVGEDNQLAGYSTTGTGVFVSAYSEGGTLDANWGPAGYGFTSSGRAITTTNQVAAGADGGCPGGLGALAGLTCSFNGTSAAAPIAAGVMALMLEANPDLSVRDIQHILQRTAVPINFDPVATYWTNLVGYGQADPDDPNIDNPTFWQVNSGDVKHSDEYGFGLIDAEAAVDLARTWGGLNKLIVLDTGTVTDVEAEVPDATFEELGALSDTQVLNALVPGDRVAVARTLASGAVTGLACARENLRVETVEVTLTVSGDGPGDLLIVLQSPRGSVSPLAIPRADSSAPVPGTSYLEYKFTTYKHWGELSGGTWNLFLQDFRPNEDSPEGTLPTDDDPGEEQITLLGPLGLPGASDHGEKSVVSVRLRIYGTETGLEPTLACPPGLTTCPGDLNGDGVVNTRDLQLFFQWYNDADLRADITGDGILNFADIVAFRGIWAPGFCGGNGGGGPGGRPINPPSVGPDEPTVRPI
jgi:hypothetical protein